jgi:hypothetical protein
VFAPLTEGERAAALRLLTSDPRLAAMAQIGRYRVIAAEPLAVKRSHPRADHRLARVVAYDYATDRCVDAAVDLDDEDVARLSITRSQPVLAPEEEEAAIATAIADDRVKAELSLGDEPQAAMQYWSERPADLARTRRCAAVLFGQLGARPSVVAVVDLIDAQVTEVVPAAEW